MPKATTKKTSNGPLSRRVNLKSKNAVHLWSFIGINLALFLAVFITKGFVASSIDQFWKRVTTKDGIIAASIPLLTIVLTGFVNDLNKARLVFWRWRNPLPGSRAFTELIKSDPRIDIPALKRKLGEFPRNAQAQNSLWYGVYKKHRDSLEVSEAHRIYLLTRDMATLAAAFLLFFSIGITLDSIPFRLVAIYCAILFGQYLLIAISARNYGIRFVLTVLTEESHSA
jgi:hypothetical protein